MKRVYYACSPRKASSTYMLCIKDYHHQRSCTPYREQFREVCRSRDLILYVADGDDLTTISWSRLSVQILEDNTRCVWSVRDDSFTPDSGRAIKLFPDSALYHSTKYISTIASEISGIELHWNVPTDV